MREFTQEEKDKWEAFKQIDDRIMKEIYISEAKEEGKAEGIEQGQLKLINSMLENGISLEQISKMTNLSLEELNKLIKN